MEGVSVGGCRACALLRGAPSIRAALRSKCSTWSCGGRGKEGEGGVGMWEVEGGGEGSCITGCGGWIGYAGAVEGGGGLGRGDG